MAPFLSRFFLAAWLLAAPLSAVFAQEAAPPPAIALSGQGIEPANLTPESLSAFPSVTMDVSFMTSKGEQKGRYEGVLLWAVLEKAGLTKSAGHNAELKRTFEVTGSDGYAIAFSVGEIAPEFGATPVIIALKVDGKPLAAKNLRLIVPGDKRGARNVRDIASITLW